MASTRYFILLLVFLVTPPLCLNYKHVLLMHGILDGKQSMFTLKDTIQRYHPGTNVTIINMYCNLNSTTPMWSQIEGIKAEYEELINSSTDGMHIIGFSQGGLISRALIQTITNHNFHTFVALSSPLMGEYGIPIIYEKLIPNITMNIATKFFYSKIGQKLSIGNYWNDPYEHKTFMEKDIFLAQLNYPIDSTYRDNFIRLNKLILIGGEKDEVIIPWQSSQFGFFDDNHTALPMEKQDVYENDTFGLKTLLKDGKLLRFTYNNIFHTHWHQNLTIIKESILPYLD